jgi:CHAT domain-containing protein
MNPLNPMFTRLDLSPGDPGDTENDGRLEVREILALDVGARLVFLSGCETGRAGAWATGFETQEDYATLAHAFLYAGARNVVATLWRVSDDGAAVLAARFYEALRDRDPVDALSVAQRAMLSDPRYRAPYFWAAYQISGSGGM